MRFSVVSLIFSVIPDTSSIQGLYHWATAPAPISFILTWLCSVVSSSYIHWISRNLASFPQTITINDFLSSVFHFLWTWESYFLKCLINISKFTYKNKSHSCNLHYKSVICFILIWLVFILSSVTTSYYWLVYLKDKLCHLYSPFT